MSENILVAKLRDSKGKGPARRLRMKNELPAVIYGKNQQTISITVSPKESTKILKGPLRRNVLINLKVDGQKPFEKLVMLKERQIHPVKRELIHLDFVEVDLKTPVLVSVPVVLKGKNNAVTLGGKLEHVLQKIKINALANQIPELIEVDITPIDFGSTHASDIALPAGVTLAEKPKVVVLTIKRPRGQKAEGEEAAAAGKDAKKK